MEDAIKSIADSGTKVIVAGGTVSKNSTLVRFSGAAADGGRGVSSGS